MWAAAISPVWAGPLGRHTGFNTRHAVRLFALLNTPHTERSDADLSNMHGNRVRIGQIKKRCFLNSALRYGKKKGLQFKHDLDSGDDDVIAEIHKRHSVVKNFESVVIIAENAHGEVG